MYNTSAVDSSMPYYITVHHWFIPNTSQKEHNYPVTVVIKLHNFLTKHHWSDVDIFKALLFLFLYTTSFPIFSFNNKVSDITYIINTFRKWDPENCMPIPLRESSLLLACHSLPGSYLQHWEHPVRDSSWCRAWKYNDITESGVSLVCSIHCIECYICSSTL